MTWDEFLALTNFECLRKLGEGDYGEVYEMSDSKETYAMKVFFLFFLKFVKKIRNFLIFLKILIKKIFLGHSSYFGKSYTIHFF